MVVGVTTLDFIDNFDISESPAGEANISLKATITADNINERTGAHGVVVDGVLIKDSYVGSPSNFNIGFYGTFIQLGDGGFSIFKAGSNPRIAVHPADYLSYDRASDYFSLFIGDTERTRISASGIHVDAVAELTSDAGVTIDSVLLKDGVVAVGDVGFDDGTSDPVDTTTAAADGAENSVARKDHAHKLHDHDHTGDAGDGAQIAGASALSDIGIADNKMVQVDGPGAGAPADDEYARWTANGLEGRAVGEVRTDINVADGADVTGDNAPKAHGPSSHTEGTAWRLTYLNASGDETEIVLGADGTFLESNGASAAPAFRAIVHGDVGVSGLKQSVMLTAGGGAATTTSGCGGPTKVEAGTNDVDYWTLEFDKDSDEYAFWGPIPTPDNWDASTLTAVFYWTTAAGGAAETVSWDIQMIALDDNDAIDRAWGTAVTVNDTWIADGDIHESAVSGAITPATTVSRAAGDLLYIRVMRDVSDDDLGGDARLIAVKLEFGITALSA